MDDNHMSSSPLFVGLTIPPMTMGVPLQFFGVNFMLSGIGLIFFLSLFAKLLVILLFSLPLYGIAYVATRKDAHWINIWSKKLSKASPIRNHSYWKTNSYSP